MKRIAILHGAGYVGRELIRAVLNHPGFELAWVTSRSFGGRPIWEAHPELRDTTDLVFRAKSAPNCLPDIDAVIVAAGHGDGARAVCLLLDAGFDGHIVDMSADFRFMDPAVYEARHGIPHPHPALLKAAWYGLPELTGGPGLHRLIANPGCFATAISLALFPIARHLPGMHCAITALTGASGSGTISRPGTHYPDRAGNLRAYRVLAHQHADEVRMNIRSALPFSFVPVSGPWTRGIWGTIQLALPAGIVGESIGTWFRAAYGEAPMIRLWENQLPEMAWCVGTPFCDIGWMVREDRLVVGFSLDNLLKGAASQAIQNLNLALGWPEETGLLAREMVV